MDWQDFLKRIRSGSIRDLSRAVSIIENELPGCDELLALIDHNDKARIIGVTGAPGAGKSTLTNAMIEEALKQEARVAVLCIDPSSPFHQGAFLGDRIRLTAGQEHPTVFIRSLSSRGSHGGLHPRIVEISELLCAVPFDYVFIETVGVGQSEVEIAGLADLTLVVTTPEAGDEVQTLKSGLMEVGDIFVVNKADRPGSDLLARFIEQSLAFLPQDQEPVICKTVASEKKGTTALFEKIRERLRADRNSVSRKAGLLANRTYYAILHRRMEQIDKNELKKEIEKQLQEDRPFRLRDFLNRY